MKISGAVFDMDGTLLDSMTIWKKMGENYLFTKGITPVEDINQIVISRPLSQSVDYIKETYQLADTKEQIRADFDYLLEQFYREKVKVKEGVEDFLKLLKKDGVRTCVATATALPLAEIALKKTGLYSYFDDVLSCHTLKKGKEFPDIYEYALAKLGTKKEETYIFEDALYAANTVKKAGFLLVGVYDAFEEEQEQLKLLSDRFFHTFTDIIKCYHGRKCEDAT